MNRLLKVTLMTVMIGCLSGCSTKINNESVNTPNASTDTEVRTNEGVQDELLPYGTVVLLKDSTKRIMIYGHNQKIAGDTADKVWDYAACYYPEGRLNNESTFMFDSEQIEKVDFEGLKQLSDATLQTDKGDKWLPVGSVVEVEGVTEPIIIIGRYQKNGDTGEIFDYIGCSYEKGNVSAESTLIFNHDMITGLYFTGYEDEEEIAFEEKLNSVSN